MRKAGASTSPSPTSQRKKRARRSSAQKLAVPADGPTSARAASSGLSGTPATGKGNRRRPATQDFPWSFPRLDKATVPPPNRRRASAGVGRRAEAKAASSSVPSSGGCDDGSGSGGGVGRHSSGGLLHLSAHDIAVACAGAGVLASVSASRLDELFFGGSSTDAAAGTSDGENTEGVSSSAGVGGAGRGFAEMSPTMPAGRGGGAIGDCGLFEDLAPLSASLYSSPIDLAAAEAKAEAHAEVEAEAEAEVEAKAEAEAKANADSGSCSPGTPVASAKTPLCAETPPCGETSPDDKTLICRETPPCSEEQGIVDKRPADRRRSADGGRTEGSWPSSAGSSGGRSLRRGTRRAAAVFAIEDIRLQAAGGEAGRGVAETWVDVQGGRRRRRRRDEGDSGSAGGAGAGDSASSSSVQETPSPQVCALETPPSSPSERHRPSPSSSPPASSHSAAATSTTAPCDNGATAASPSAPVRPTRPAIGPVPTDFCADVPETQPPPPPPPNRREARDETTRRTRSGKAPRGSGVSVSQTPPTSTRKLRSRGTMPESQRVSPAPSSADVTRRPGAGGGPLGVDVGAAMAAVTAVAAPVQATEAKTEAAKEAVAVGVTAAAPERGQEIAVSPRVGSDREQDGAPAVAVPGRGEEIVGSPHAEGGQEGGDAKGMLIIDAPRSLLAGKAGGRLTGLSEASPTVAVTTSAGTEAAVVTTSAVAGVTAVAAAAVSGQYLPPPPPPPLVSSHGDADASSAADVPRRDHGQKRDRALAQNEKEVEPQTSAAGGECGVDACAVARSEDPSLPEPDALAAHAASPSSAIDGTAPDAGYRGEPEVRGAGEEKVPATEAVDSHVAMVEAHGGPEATAETPARPRQLAGKFDSACGDLGRAAEGDDDVIASEGSQHDPGEYGETPSSGALFDYSPAGCSQMSDDEETKQGVTAAEMLVSFKRNLRPELPGTPTRSLTLAAPAPAGRALSAARGSLVPAKPRVTPRVPNPYDTGVGKLLTPRAIAGKARPMPTSPFALAASAAAARREAAVSAAAAAAKKAASMASPKPALPVAFPDAAPSSAGASAPAPAVLREKRHPTRPGGSGSSSTLHPERTALTSGLTRKTSADQGALRTAARAHAPLAKVGAGPPPAKDAKTLEIGPRVDGGADVSARLSLPAAGHGFQTARGKTLAVSTEALANVKHLFDEAPSGSMGASAADAVPCAAGAGVKRDATAGKNPPPPTLRETSATATVTVGVNSGRAMKSDGRDGVSGLGKGPLSTGNGFQTARGRPLAVSDEALAKVQHLFKEDTEGTVTPSAAGAGPRRSAAEVGRVDEAEKAPPTLGKAAVDTLAVESSSTRAAKGDRGKRIPSYGKGPPSAGNGFQTGRGRPLAVSDEALAKVQHLFREETEDTIGPSVANAGPRPAMAEVRGVIRIEKAPPATLEKANVDTLAVGSSSMSAVKGDGGKRIPSHGKGPPSAGNGFQTARGRPLAVSEEALAKVQHLFKEVTEDTVNPSAAGAGPLPAVAGVKGVVGTEKSQPPALGKARGGTLAVRRSSTRMADNGGKGVPSHGKAPPSSSNGFRTGRGGALAVCDEALAKVQHLFKETPQGEANRSTITTATSLSEGVALARQDANETMSLTSWKMDVDSAAVGDADPKGSRKGRAKGEANYYENGVHSAGLKMGGAGFQTGRGRAIPVSSEALAKVQHIFRDDDNDGNGRDNDNTSRRPCDMPAPQPPGYAQHSRAKPAGSTTRTSTVAGTFHARDTSRGGASVRGGLKCAVPLVNPAIAQEGGVGSKAALPGDCGGGEMGQVPGGSGDFPGAGAAFQTAGGRELHVSEEAMARAGKLFSDAENDLSSSAVPPTTPVPEVRANPGAASAALPSAPATEVGGRVLGAADQENADPSVPPLAATGRTRTGGNVGGGRSGVSSGTGVGGVGVSERGGQSDSAAATAIATAGYRPKDDFCGTDVRACLETTGNAIACQIPEGRASTTHAEEKVGVNQEFADSEAGHGGYNGAAVSLGPSCVEAGGGFRTARGRALIVSAEALAKVGHLFENDEPSDGVDASTVPPAGKKGGLAGKVITSERRRVVGDSGVPQGVAASGCVSRKIHPPRVAASGTRVADTVGGNVGDQEGGVAAKRTAPAPPREPMKSGKPYLVSGGGGSGGGFSNGGSGGNGGSNTSLFSTGGGKAIEVSAEALARVEKVFSESERLVEPVQTRQPTLKSGHSSLAGVGGSGGSGGGGGGGSSRNGGGSGRSSASLFSTGGGKAIKVSAEALARLENMFLESERLVEPIQTQQPPVKSSNPCLAGGDGGGGRGGGWGGGGGGGSGSSGRSSGSLFSAGGGKSMEVSAEGLVRVENMLSESERLVEPAQNQPPRSKSGNLSLAGGGGGVGGGSSSGSSGRSSGSLILAGGGKAIEVSAEALARVENMFSESERLAERAQNQPPPSLADCASGEGALGSRVTSCGNGVSFQAPLKEGTGQSREKRELDSGGEPEHFRVDDVGNGRDRGGSSGSSNSSTSDVVSGASVLSTRRRRHVEVSAEALARAQKMLGEPDPCPADNALHNQRPTLRAGAGGAGWSDGSGSGVWGDSRSAGRGRDIGGSALTPRLGTPSPAKLGYTPRDGGRRPGTGKENSEDEPRESALGATAARRAGAWGPGPLAGHSPMSTRQRSVSTPVREAATGGQSPALGSRAVFSPPKRVGTMPPPAGVGTPSSLKRPLARRSTPAGVPAPSSTGRVTPQPTRGLGAVCGVSSGGGLHAAKRPRSASVLSSSAKRRGVAGFGAFPRPSPGRQGAATGSTSPRVTGASHGRGGGSGGADPSGEGLARAATAPSGSATLPEPDCRASRVLFRSLSAADAEAVGMNRQRRQSCQRRPLSSLLDEPPQVSETLSRAGRSDILPADEPAKPAEAAAIAAAEVEAVVGAKMVGEYRNAEKQQTPVTGNGVGTAARLQAAVMQKAREGIVAALLGRVTSVNACDLRFSDVDGDCGDLISGGGGRGRPCCFTAPPAGTPACASKSATGGTPVGGREQGGDGPGCERHRRGAQEPGSTRFRDELLRGGGDGQLATPTWVENHVRWIVWKLAATERRFPEHFPRGYLTAERVAHQLRYRYDVELDRAKKPCLKAVLQGDASASRPMVLCVSRVYSPEDLGARGDAAAAVVEVTDGWYPVDASLDDALAHFLRRGKIVPGTKLSLSNAALEAGGGAPSSGGDGGGGVAGADPLELLRRCGAGELPPGAGPRLRLVVNSTRRARWDARLGFFRPKRDLPRGRGGGGQGSGGDGISGGGGGEGASCERQAQAGGEQSALEVPLCTVVPGGGIVTATRVLILRRYPAVYISESFSGNAESSRGGGEGGGGTGGGGRGGAQRRSLSEAEEEGEKALHQARLQRAIEAAASGMEEEVMEELEESTPESFRRMKEAENPSSFFDSLDIDDQNKVSEWRERHQQVVEGLRQKAMDDRLRNMDGVDRRVRQLITLRVACVCIHAGDSPCGGSGVGRSGDGGKGPKRSPRRHALPPMVAVLKMWGPNEATAALLMEGAELRLHSVTASSCHYHVPGCSLELSAGRQTKIEVLSAPSPSTPRRSSTDPTVGAARPTNDPRGDQAVNPRFVPRPHTPLSAFSSPPTVRIVGSASGFDGRVVRKAVSARFAGPPVVRDAAEADFVGCVFAVTRESLSPTGVRETFASPDSVVSPVASGGGRGSGAGVAMHRNTGTGRDATDLAAKEAETRGQARDANGDAAPEFVIYHVYLTDSSGACVRLKKRVRTELARHHRILRSAPGTCWVVVNAGLETTSSDELGSRGGAGRDVLAVGDPKLSCVGRGGARGVQTVSWSSMTAVGGSGSAPPPRTVGGAPTGHLERPLLALRRWAESGDGRAAVSRERQRLAVLLTRETRATASAPVVLQPPGLAVRPGGGGGGGGSSEGLNASTSAAPRGGDGENERRETRTFALPAQGQEALESDDIVVGFVSSFSVFSPSCVDGGGRARDSPSSRGDDAALWLHVDTGGRMLAVQLVERALGQLLGLTLDKNGRSSATCRSSTAVGAPGKSSQNERPVEGRGDVPRRLSDARGLLRAIAALGVGATREEHTSGLVDGNKGGMETSAGTAVVKQAAALSEPPAARAGKSLAVTENASAVAGTVARIDMQATPGGDPEPSLDGREVDAGSDSVVAADSKEEAVNALTAAVFGMVRQCRHSCGPLFSYVSCPAASTTVGAVPVALEAASAPAGAKQSAARVPVSPENAREPTEPTEPAPTVDAGISVDDKTGRGSKLLRTCGTEEAASTVGVGSGVGATEEQLAGASVVAPVWESGCAEAFLRDLASACGRKQLEFSVLRSCSQVLGREVGVVEGVGAVDAARSARSLLEDLAGSCGLL